MNFLPEDYLEKKFRRRSAVVCATLLGVVIGGVTVTATAFRVSIKQLQDQQKSVHSQWAVAYQTIQNFAASRARQQNLARQAELTASLLEKQPPRSSILSEIGRALPLGVSLTDLTMNPADDPNSLDEIITLSGKSSSDALVRELVAQLQRSRLFTNVQRLTPDAVGANGGAIEFHLQMMLDSRSGVSNEPPQRRSETVFLDPE